MEQLHDKNRNVNKNIDRDKYRDKTKERGMDRNMHRDTGRAWTWTNHGTKTGKRTEAKIITIGQDKQTGGTRTRSMSWCIYFCKIMLYTVQSQKRLSIR